MAETFESMDDGPGVVSLPVAELPEIKLFGRWSCDDVNIEDISLHVSQIY